jgi:uncharacterized protein YqcC (DUF446 family)
MVPEAVEVVVEEPDLATQLEAAVEWAYWVKVPMAQEVLDQQQTLRVVPVALVAEQPHKGPQEQTFMLQDR